MPLPTEDDYKLVRKNLDEAIANLVDAVPPRTAGKEEGGYSEQVYELVWKLVEAGDAMKAAQNYKITNMKEYKAEIKRRRKIGLTIDPATAETMFRMADCGDPYDILDAKYNCECIHETLFVRHPGAGPFDWVDFRDLPEATRKTLLERATGESCPFLNGLNPEDDINKWSS